MSRIPVVIIGHGYTSRLGIIRSLGVIGCEITVLVQAFHSRLGRWLRFDGGTPVDCCSKYVSRVLWCPAESEPEMLRILLEQCVVSGRKVVLIPDSDFSTAVISRHEAELAPYFLFPSIKNGSGTLESWMDKSLQKALARTVGLPVADARVIPAAAAAGPLPEGIVYPCFTKPVETIHGGKTFRRCDDAASLQRALAEIAAHGGTQVLVEEYKPIDTEYAVVGYSDGEGTVCIPAVIEFTEAGQRHFGIARTGKVLPPDAFAALLEQFATFVRKTGFAGLFDIDFYLSGGTLYFNELNLRFGGSGYAVTRMGVNLPALYVRSICGEDTSDMPRKVAGTGTFVNERMCIDDWSFYYLTEDEFRSRVAAADIRFVDDADDPGPQRKLDRYVRQQKMKRILRKWLKK
ncbi:MAG: ATP-grasp domain-containing protein [Bacteroidales bacterium]|nr:ATP-grasp domain-containing protein [Bacteroidales bacterium]